MTSDDRARREVIIKRLKKVEGQVRGLQKMVDTERDCESIVTQLAAIRSAIESVGQLVLNNYMQICFRKETEPENPTAALARVVGIWNRVRVRDNT